MSQSHKHTLTFSPVVPSKDEWSEKLSVFFPIYFSRLRSWRMTMHCFEHSYSSTAWKSTEMQRHSDCGLDTCNITDTMSHPLTHLNKRGTTMRDNFHLKLDHKKPTQGSRRTLKDWNVNTLKSVNCVANWTSHLCSKENDLCTAPPRFTKRSFYFKLWTCHRSFTLNYFTFFIVPQTPTCSFIIYFFDICCVRNY